MLRDLFSRLGAGNVSPNTSTIDVWVDPYAPGDVQFKSSPALVTASGTAAFLLSVPRGLESPGQLRIGEYVCVFTACLDSVGRVLFSMPSHGGCTSSPRP